jgi:hypothetical protein
VGGVLRAQIFDFKEAREPIAKLDGLWRFHAGDDLSWASPDFDDSQWALLQPDKDWNQQGYKDLSGIAWYRFRVVVPAGSDPYSLYLPVMVTSYQIYADGGLIGGCGGLPPHPVGRYCHANVFDLPRESAAGPRTITIALRVWQRAAWASYDGGGPHGSSYFGESGLLHVQMQSHLYTYIHSVMQYYFLVLLASLGALFSFALFIFRRNDREYLWFGCLLLFEAAGHALELYNHVAGVKIVSYSLYAGLIENLGSFSALAFYYVLLRGRRSWLFYAALAGVVLSTAGSLLYSLPEAGRYIPAGEMDIFSDVVMLPLAIWILALLLQRVRERLVDASLLLAPVLLVYVEWLASSFVIISYQLGWQNRFQQESFPVFSEPFPLDFHVLAELLFLIAMLAILVNRFARARTHEERYANEFEAARTVQSLLVSANASSTPGFDVESVYLPAQEVGGDFFQVQPGDDGSLLIVVGDVSGKGLQAAMTVSTIVGALRSEKERRPAELLRNLNRVLHGQIAGFVTCTAALVASDGTVTLANAGNLAPYRNGEEVAVSSALPLGILADIAYEETHYRLAPGDRLTFLSDGVVEATNDKRELFGFARAQAISRQPANAIAEVARKFGQQDDISVLSITRMAAMPA